MFKKTFTLLFLALNIQAQEGTALKIRQPIPNYLNQDLVLCSFGASVTQEKDGIWDHFVHKLNEKTNRHHKHLKMGYVGESLIPTNRFVESMMF